MTDEVTAEIPASAMQIGRRFVGKRAFITGAGSGIGRATAQRLASEGARVACVDLRGADATATAIGDGAFAVECDVSKPASVAAAVAAAVGALGGLDIVCNIAGIGHFAWSHEEAPEDFDRILAVNLNGTFYVCRYTLPHLLEAGAGVILNTASNAGLHGLPWSAAYCASKGGVVNLTRALAYEYRPKKIRVNAVAPGGTNTAITEQFRAIPDGADYKEMMKMMSPWDIADPSEMAAAFAYLASDEARYATGSILVVDGGLTC